MPRHSVASLLGSFVLVACGGTAGTHFQTLTNPDANFDGMATVAFVEGQLPAPYERLELPADYRESAGAAVRAEVARLGWTLVENADDADLVVYAAIGRRTQEVRARGQVNCCPGFSFGETVAGMDGELTRGALVFEAFDRSGDQVWYGHAHRNNRNLPSAEKFGRIVTRLFVNFPRASSAPAQPTPVEPPAEPSAPAAPVEE